MATSLAPTDQLDEAPLTLAEYADRVGQSVRKVQRDAKLGRIPTWRDPATGRTSTSLAAVMRVRLAAARKSEAEFLQRHKLARV